MVMVLILLFMAIETQIWNSDGGALTSPPALLFIMLEREEALVGSPAVIIPVVESGDTLPWLPAWSRSLPSASRLDRVL